MMRALELVARGACLALGAGAFAYTAVYPVTGAQGAAGGAALVLGLYLGFTPWSTLKRLINRKSPGGS
jgi:hypothetical protein